MVIDIAYAYWCLIMLIGARKLDKSEAPIFLGRQFVYITCLHVNLLICQFVYMSTCLHVLQINVTGGKNQSWETICKEKHFLLSPCFQQYSIVSCLRLLFTCFFSDHKTHLNALNYL